DCTRSLRPPPRDGVFRGTARIPIGAARTAYVQRRYVQRRRRALTGPGIPPRRRRGSRSLSPTSRPSALGLFRLMARGILALLDENDNAISRPELRQFAATFGSASPRNCHQDGRPL